MKKPNSGGQCAILHSDTLGVIQLDLRFTYNGLIDFIKSEL